jgi:hypothetical protein
MFRRAVASTYYFFRWQGLFPWGTAAKLRIRGDYLQSSVRSHDTVFKIRTETTLHFHMAGSCFVWCFTYCHLECHEHSASVIRIENFHGFPQSLKISYSIVSQTMPQPVPSTQLPIRTVSVFLTSIVVLSQLMTAPWNKPWINAIQVTITFYILFWEAACHLGVRDFFFSIWGTWKFISALTSVHHSILPWAGWIQYSPPHPLYLKNVVMLWF